MIPFAYLRNGQSVSLEDIYFNLLEAMDLALRYAASQMLEDDEQ